MTPKNRLDCLPGGKNEARPCPYKDCRHALKGGECVLDKSSESHSLKEVAKLLGMTVEDVQRQEVRALAKLKEKMQEAYGGPLL